MFMRFPPRAAWLAGVGLAQFGEFGFVILQLATKENVVTSDAIAPLLNAGILSMFLTPLIVYKAPHFTAGERVLDPLAKLLRAKSAEDLEQKTVGHNDHVIIIGYGISGELLASSLRTLSIETVVLEMNSDNVSKRARTGRSSLLCRCNQRRGTGTRTPRIMPCCCGYDQRSRGHKTRACYD